MVNKTIGIVGTQGFNNYELLSKTIDDFIIKNDINIDYIVSGGSKGADTLAMEYAYKNKILTIEHLPDWDKYGKSAGPIRNNLIVKDSDIIFAFWDGISKGTLNTINQANSQNKKLYIINYNNL